MGDKEIKSWLKEAREHIKLKEYKNALKECKKVLHKDKSNYLGLVFCGLALSELDQPDQALQAYRRAVESSPDQAVAWEGVLKFYDKHKDFGSVEEKAEVLDRLVELHKEDTGRCYDLWGKQAQLHLQQEDWTRAVETLQQQAEAGRELPVKRGEALQTLISVLAAQSGLSEIYTDVYREALEEMVTANQTPNNLENLKHLIRLLYRVRDYSAAARRAAQMSSVFPDSLVPLEWICKLFLEATTGAYTVQCEELDSISDYIARLDAGSAGESALGRLARGAELWRDQKTAECVAALLEDCTATAANPNIYGQVLLCQAQHCEGEMVGAEEVGRLALARLDKVRDLESRHSMQQRLEFILVHALYSQFITEKYELALPTIRRLPLAERSPEFQLVAAKLLAAAGHHAGLEEVVARLQQLHPALDTVLVEVQVALWCGEGERAEQLLTAVLAATPDCWEGLLLLGGQLLSRADHSAALPLLLKAAKLNPRHWQPFLHLGRLYSRPGQQQAEKARKCWARCLQLRPGCEEAGAALSDLLRTAGRHEENLAVLAGAGSQYWALLRLGLHHLAVDQPGQAVTALQAGLRARPTSPVCWEALASAYLARGSLTAAKKAFQRVLELEPGGPGEQFAKLMVASIRHRLGHYTEAVADYSAVLMADSDCLPALRGQAESWVALARHYLDTAVVAGAADCVGRALAALTRAAELRPGLAGTWRLLGEAAGLADVMPPRTVVQVPGRLVTKDQTEAVVPLCRDGVLEVAARCYSRCLAVGGEQAGVWHELGRVRAGLQQPDRALAAARRAVSLAPRQATLWSSLGALYCRQEDWARAQHCLVTALNIEASAAAWTNLGAIYLALGEHGLANRAFKEAQNCEPGYVRGWAGQALVAEAMGVQSEAMDLFRHCAFLGGCEAESGRGYGAWVCDTLARLDRKDPTLPPHNAFIVQHMWGAALAVDSLAALCRLQSDDCLAQVHLGLLCERQGLLRSALAALERAVPLAGSQAQRDAVAANTGRLLARLDRPQQAVVAFAAVQSPDLRTQAGLALALTAAGQPQQAYQAYQSCLSLAESSPGTKSQLLVAMGSLAYRVEGVPAAKTLLFQSCQLTPPAVRGLFALAVIGIQHSDLGLVEAALAELLPHQHNPAAAPDCAFLRAAVLVLRGDVAGARRGFLRAAHTQPWLARTWHCLATFLLQNSPRDARAAAALAGKAAGMARSAAEMGDEGECGGAGERSAECLVVRAVALLVAGKNEAALRAAQAAVRLHPDRTDCWAALAAAARMQPTVPTWTRTALHHVQRLGGAGELAQWAGRVVASL